MSLNNKQLSLLITFFIMVLFVLILFNIQLAGQQEEEFLYELTFDEKIQEEILEEEVIKPDLAELETHQAYNEAEKSRYADELQKFKTLEELAEERQASESENPDKSDELDENSINTGFAQKYAEKLKEQKQKLAENNKQKSDAKEVNIKRRTTISYSLVDRSHLKLPNPVYTCESFGKVVINVTVDGLGNVIDASYNKGSSTTANGCLIDNAIKYAMGAKFTKDTNKTEQLGTITYLFQGE